MSLTLAPPLLSAGQINLSLLHAGLQWVGSPITFSFPTAASTWPGYDPGDEPFVGFTALNSQQQTAFRAAITAWDRLIPASFAETDDLAAAGMIRVAFTTHDNTDDAAAYAYLAPMAGIASPWNGDIWFNTLSLGSSFLVGGASYHTMLHELGHTLGLRHPFEGGSPLPSSFDNGRYSVMSYTEPRDLVAVSITETATTIQGRYAAVYSQTPMVLDVAAVQLRYGSDPTTAAGPDRYTFSPTQPFYMTIYDAGGEDTIDLTGFVRGSDIDLAPGAYSSIGLYSVEAQIAELTARYPWAADYVRDLFNEVAARYSTGVYTWSNNLGIAFSTTIENAIGGSGYDTLTGNDVGNNLQGGLGLDYIRGLGGDDTIDGGADDDDVNGNVGSDLVRGGFGADLVRGGQGADTVYGDQGNDPHVNGNLGDDMVYGAEGNDTVFGGQGADTLYGEDGNDWLSGDLGADVLVGGPGGDRFIFRVGGGMDWVTDFSSQSGDRVQLSTGTAYTVITVNGNAVIDLGNGDQLGLAGVTVATMSEWLVFA